MFTLRGEAWSGTVCGVDFSGAKLAGRATWIARVEPDDQPPGRVLAELARLEDLGGTAARSVALAHLVTLIDDSRRTLWSLDFPFGLPYEVVGYHAGWTGQFDLLREWDHDGYGLGAECLRRAKALGGPNHIRRLTDLEERAPFDPYHYRIIWQLFHGMRDVLGPLRHDPTTAILPFHYDRRRRASRLLTEACPASTLKRLGLPHQNYKQCTAGRLKARQRRTRHLILAGLEAHLSITPRHRRVIMGDNGGDALDAVLAAVGALRSWARTDHALVAGHHLYLREGRLYV
jgi:hypothetical protein